MYRTACFGALLLAALGAPAFASEADELAIRELQQQQAEAWNAHDIDRYSALFTPDADVINVLGWHWRSRDELRQKLGVAFASVFSQSRLTIVNVSVEFPSDDVAVAHVTWTLAGAVSPTGAAGDTPERGIQTQVLVRADGDWRISHFQNTNSVPERPFPPAP